MKWRTSEPIIDCSSCVPARCAVLILTSAVLFSLTLKRVTKHSPISCCLISFCMWYKKWWLWWLWWLWCIVQIILLNIYILEWFVILLTSVMIGVWIRYQQGICSISFLSRRYTWWDDGTKNSGAYFGISWCYCWYLSLFNIKHLKECSVC